MVLDGATRVSGFVVVGGDLTVHGDFECVGVLLCLGHVNIQGNLKCPGNLLVGCGVEVSGDLRGGRIRAWSGFEEDDDFEDVAEEILEWMPRPPKVRKEDEDVVSAWEFLTDQDTLWEVARHQSYALSVKGDCYCGNTVTMGQIQVGGYFNPDDVDSTSFAVEAQSICIEGDIQCGSLSASGEISIQGDLHCSDVECWRLDVAGEALVEQLISTRSPDRLEADDDPRRLELNSDAYDVECGRDPMEKLAPDEVHPSLDCGTVSAGSVTSAGSIRSYGSISCDTYLKANRSILAGGAITTGKLYGVLAGIGVPRDRWLVSGYVCSPEKPPRILTGVYRALGRRRSIYLKPAGLPKPPRSK